VWRRTILDADLGAAGSYRRAVYQWHASGPRILHFGTAILEELAFDPSRHRHTTRSAVRTRRSGAGAKLLRVLVVALGMAGTTSALRHALPGSRPAVARARPAALPPAH